MDFQDKADIIQHLENIEHAVGNGGATGGSSSDGPLLETSTKLILFPIILGVLFVFSIISVVFRLILMGSGKAATGLLAFIFTVAGLFLKKIGVDLDGEYGFLIVLLFTGLILLLLLVAVILIVVAIVKKKRKKKIAKQKQYINKNQNSNPTSGSSQAYGNVPQNASKIIVQQRNTQGVQRNVFSKPENRSINTNPDQNVNSVGEANQTPVLSEDQIENLKKLKDLLDAKILTEEEFNIKKKEILGL